MENKELSVFGEIFYLILEQMLSSKSNVSEIVKMATKDLKEEMYDEIYSNGNSEARSGIQAKVSAFFKTINDDVFEVANLEDKKYYDTFYNAFASYLFCSPLLIESKGQYKTFNLEDIVPYNDETSKIKSKKNEIFANILFTNNKRPNVYKLCELSTFLTILLLKFNLSSEDIFYKCISLLRKRDFTFFCDSKVVLDGAITKWINSDKKYLCEGLQYDRKEIFSLVSSLEEKRNIVYATSELLYLTIAWFDGCVQEEARKAINRWIDVVMGDNFKEAFDYWRYLWIRYRRLPIIDRLTPEQHSLYTVDNVYLVPTFYDNNGNKTCQILSKHFNDSKSRCTILSGEVGKTAIMHTIISIISMNSSYANYRGGKQMGVSPYYKDKYDKLKEELFGENDKTDIVPLIINGAKFGEYLKENTKEISVIDFAYYLIQSYNSQLNLSGERNVTWFNKWKEIFYFDKFSSLIMGALEDRKLLLLIDGYDQITIKNQKIFDNMVLDFVSNYGSNCEIIATCYDKDKLPKSLKSNHNEFTISLFNEKQYMKFIKNFIVNVQQIDNSGILKEELINAYNNHSKEEINLIEEKIESIKDKLVVPSAENIQDAILYNPLFLTNVLFKRLIKNIDINNSFKIEELDDVAYLKIYINSIINDELLDEKYDDMFKIKIFNALEKILIENKFEDNVRLIFEYREENMKKYNILNNALKMLYKVSYDEGTAAQIKEYIKFISKNIG